MVGGKIVKGSTSVSLSEPLIATLYKMHWMAVLMTDAHFSYPKNTSWRKCMN